MKKSVQLYSIRNLSKQDFEASLRVVSEIGYEGVEFAGFFDHAAEQVAEWLKKYNLVASGSHVQHEMMFGNPKEVIEYHKAIGCDCIICPIFDIKSPKDVEVLAEKFKAVAPLYKEAGMTMAYHNHILEYQESNGVNYLEMLANSTDPKVVKFELDVYWVYRGGSDPVSEMKKYSDRLVLFHAKDGDDKEGLTLGTGNVDMPEVFKLAKELGIEWAVVEAEASEDPDDQVKAITEDFAALLKLSNV